MKTLALVFCLSFAASIFGQKRDTVDILDNDYNSYSSPKRSCSISDNGLTYLDSIMIDGIMIPKHKTDYYLQVYDEHGILRIEGDYWDEYKNGLFREFDEKGRLVKEGQYALRALKKPVKLSCKFFDDHGQAINFEYTKEFISVKIGTWKTYNIFGNISIEEDYVFEESRKTVKRFNPQGRLESAEIYKKGKLKERIKY